MLAEWKVEPDAGQRLVYESGSVMPVGGAPDVSGFAQVARLLTGKDSGRALTWLFAVVGLAAGAAAVWRWTARAGIYRGGAAAVFVAFALASVCVVQLGNLARTATATVPAGHDVSRAGATGGFQL